MPELPLTLEPEPFMAQDSAAALCYVLVEGC